jgi:Flp pilus assembly protein TadG
MMVIFGVILAIFQFSMVFLNAVLVNHALSQSAQEAAVRGAYDDAAQSVLLAYLPGEVRAQCLNNPCAFSTPNAEVSGVSRLGLECTKEGETFDIVLRYEQSLIFLAAIGITKDLNMQQEVTVASQSLNQQSYCK